MSDFLASLKADLTSRRLAPLLIVATVGLACALFYALHFSAPSTPTASVAAPTTSTASSTPSLTLSHASNAADQAVAETANGVSYQHQGHAHDPFTPLPSTATSSTTSATSPSTSASSTSPAATSGVQPTTTTETPTTPATTPTTTPGSKTSSKAEKRKTVYHVTVQFGAAPTTGGPTQLTTYPDLKRGQPFPVAPAAPIVVFAGVLDGGSYAIFKLVGEVFPSIGAACLPSEIQCEALKLAAGRSEQFEVHDAEGQTVLYTLQVLTIAKASVTAAAANHQDRYLTRQDRALLGPSSQTLSWGLRYSVARGVLIPVAPQHRH